MHSFRALPLVLGLLAGVPAARAQLALPIEYRQIQAGETQINFQSQAGVPISTTVGNPPGSNGQQPTGNESTGVFVPPTGGSFAG